MEKKWRDVDGRKHASLAWALNDVVGWRFWSGGVSKVSAVELVVQTITEHLLYAGHWGYFPAYGSFAH